MVDFYYMEIKVVTGVGKGKTALSSFDCALKDAGVYNYNLIHLSSIIPPNSVVIKADHYNSPAEEYGYKLYIVMAHISSNESDKYIAAGIGWYQLDGDHKGMFCEHSIKGGTMKEVKSRINQKIKDSLSDLCSFRGLKFDPKKVNSSISASLVGVPNTDVLVVAVYKSEGWE